MPFPMSYMVLIFGLVLSTRHLELINIINNIF
jgi:hypothetical protein